ncbi:hypothetical protein N5K35_26160 [Pseudomonas sp. GD03651]|uniref:hypothetical protein n=1 Tax=Pseudomonas TaxID=286 RepID=UPI00034EF131|nr:MULTISPECIES: hypothetical protein [Pseudomonas]AGN82859.1 hypothetical protein L483_20500 [Pseudomonas putida H8234]MDH2187176.1 hypothetical protein [Pseudomonas sp. GD03651]
MRLDENLDPASFAKGIFDDILGSTAPRVRSLDGRDKPKSKGNTGLMNDITREEFNARLETIEVKMDARVEAISSKIDGFLAAQVERDKRMDESIASVRRDIDRLGSLKLNIWGAMATALTIGLAITALSVTFYQTGKSDSSTAAVTPPAVSAPPSEPVKK